MMRCELLQSTTRNEISQVVSPDELLIEKETRVTWEGGDVTKEGAKALASFIFLRPPPSTAHVPGSGPWPCWPGVDAGRRWRRAGEREGGVEGERERGRDDVFTCLQLNIWATLQEDKLLSLLRPQHPKPEFLSLNRHHLRRVDGAERHLSCSSEE